VSFDKTVRQMTEMSQWPKCCSKKWPECLSEKKQRPPRLSKQIAVSCLSFSARLSLHWWKA